MFASVEQSNAESVLFKILNILWLTKADHEKASQCPYILDQTWRTVLLESVERLCIDFLLNKLQGLHVLIGFWTQIVAIAVGIAKVEVAAVCSTENLGGAGAMLGQIFTLHYSLVYQKGLVDVANFYEGAGFEDTGFSDQDCRFYDILRNILHQSTQWKHLVELFKVNQGLRNRLNCVQNLTWLQDLLVMEHRIFACTTSI